MLTIFRRSLALFRGQILGWGISLALLGGWLMTFYDTFANQREQYEKLLANYPKGMMAFFGAEGDFSLFNAAGFLNVEFFSYMPIILGIFALLVGSGLLASDEESGTLDLVLAHPVQRWQIYFGRLAAFGLALVGVLALTWVGFALGLTATTMDTTAAALMLPQLSLLAELVFVGALALLLSMVLPSRRLAAMTTATLLVGSFFLTSLARVDNSLKLWAKFSPLNYYQGGMALDGLNVGWFLGLIGFGLVFALLGWLLFERRDIRVGGEGGWRLPRLSLKRSST